MLDHAAGRRAGIVDHDVDAAERLDALRDEIPGVGVFAQIGRDGDDLAPGCLGDLLRGGLERLLAARADGDVDAFLGQRQRDALADAFAAAGDQRGLAFELEVHRNAPFEILYGLCASQRPASAAANRSASAALNAAGSSD